VPAENYEFNFTIEPIFSNSIALLFFKSSYTECN
jgi:hypothetical protein